MSRPAQMLYLVSYDVCDAKRLRRVYKVMRGFGDPLQLSVFRCVLSDVQLARLRDRLVQEIHHGEDQILFVPLGSVDAPRSWRGFTLGLPVVHPERSVKVI